MLPAEEAKGLSPAVVSRLKAQWTDAYTAWSRRDLTGEHYLSAWGDGSPSSRGGEDDG